MKRCVTCEEFKEDCFFDLSYDKTKRKNVCKKCRNRLRKRTNNWRYNLNSKNKLRDVVRLLPELKDVIKNLTLLKREIKNYENNI